MSNTEDNKSFSSKSKIVLEIDAFPFKGLKISDDWEKLDSIENRSTCSVCKKSRKYFCYTCYVAVPEIRHIVPVLKLPVKVDIIKHAREMDGKSTAVHAAVLAPDDVKIFTYPCIPDYEAEENVVLVFPNKDAVSVQEMCSKLFRKVRPLVNKRPCPDSRGCIVHRVVFIDSTWNQSRGIFKDPRIKALPSVVLRSRLSQFWRHQADSPRWYLATIEAIHQFMVELDEAQWQLDHRIVQHSVDLETNPINNTDQQLARCEDSKGEGTIPGPASSSEVISSRTNCDQANNLTDSHSEGKEESQNPNKRKSECNYFYNGKYDNLLFFFRFMYSKIHTLYDHDQLRSYKRRLE
ncbi:tRNA-uridine aminocarboxypropyltransferase 1 isoform X2 [Macrosteles quadrilineatus]|nr:tRNA-uridine aminocarboxypropyltransferase 1 isoform X2 [Macrosteles quadrilineatus]